MATAGERRLVLARHAKSAWPGVADHDRPLAPRGLRDAPVMGGWLRGEGQVPDRVLCSTALRARQTWHAMADALGPGPTVAFDDAVYRAGAADLLEIARRVPDGVRALLLIGHNPAVADLALLLAERWGGAGPGGPARSGDLDRMRAKFPTGAIAILEFHGAWSGLGPGRARLAGFAAPRDLRADR